MGGGSLSMLTRLAQVVFTLTQFPQIDAVVFRIEGQRVTVFSGEGIALDRAQTRADSENVLPAIFVDGPAYGAALGNPREEPERLRRAPGRVNERHPRPARVHHRGLCLCRRCARRRRRPFH